MEQLIRRERAVMAAALAVTTLLAWIYLVRAGAAMNQMTATSQMHAAMGMTNMAWGVGDWLTLFVMWAVMMAGMMLPSAAPVILLVLRVYRQREDPRARTAAVAFVLGYVVVWTGFSLAASGLQIALHRTALMATDMRLSSDTVAGGVLVAAGVYQWLPVKNWCLTHCQSPFGFLTQHWREGVWGGFTMGRWHGATCVGCCWLLMALLFAVGVMNLLWVAALTAFVLVEKLVPRGAILGRAAGIVFGAWGLYLVWQA